MKFTLLFENRNPKLGIAGIRGFCFCLVVKVWFRMPTWSKSKKQKLKPARNKLLKNNKPNE